MVIVQGHGTFEGHPGFAGLPDGTLSHPNTTYEWHTDGAHSLTTPPVHTQMYALEVPDRGGETMFCSANDAFDELDGAEQDAASQLHVRYQSATNVVAADGLSAQRPGVDDEEFTERDGALDGLASTPAQEEDDGPADTSVQPIARESRTSHAPVALDEGEEVMHPLVVVHPATGRRGTYAPHCLPSHLAARLTDLLCLVASMQGSLPRRCLRTRSWWQTALRCRRMRRIACWARFCGRLWARRSTTATGGARMTSCESALLASCGTRYRNASASCGLWPAAWADSPASCCIDSCGRCWDNRAVLHSGTPQDGMAGQRLIHRIRMTGCARPRGTARELPHEATSSVRAELKQSGKM
jgi:hypothetical protein